MCIRDRNNCIPPTPSFGRIEIALTIIPIPPSHWSIARQRIIPLEELSISFIIVEPVVVRPETDSKKASVTEKFCDEVINGNDAKTDKENQLKTTSIKALLISILILLPLFIRIKEIPIKKVKTLLIKKPDQFLFPSKKSKNPGISIAKESHNRKIPITDTIGCIIIDAVFIILLYTYLVSLYTIYELIILY